MTRTHQCILAATLTVACSTTTQSESDPLVLLGFEGECQQCVVESCEPEVAACGGDEGCLETAACRGQAVNPATIQTCLADGQRESVNRFVGLQGCFSRACRTACGLGSDLSCVGKYDYPRASETVGGSLTLIDSATSQPMSGVTISGCELLDPTCESPTVTTITDDAGTADLVVDVGPQSFGWRGWIQAEGGGVYPGGLYQSKPLVRRVDLGVVPFFAADALDSLSGIISPENGIVAVVINDCWSIPAGGMTVHILPNGGGDEIPVIYVDETLGLAGEQTSSAGLALSLAAPPGGYTAEVVSVETGVVVGSAGFGVTAGLATAVVIDPRPTG